MQSLKVRGLTIYWFDFFADVNPQSPQFHAHIAELRVGSCTASTMFKLSACCDAMFEVSIRVKTLVNFRQVCTRMETIGSKVRALDGFECRSGDNKAVQSSPLEVQDGGSQSLGSCCLTSLRSDRKMLTVIY